MNRKFGLSALFLLAIFLLLLSACSDTTSNRRSTPTPVPTLVKYEPAIFTVERGSLISEKSISGEIVPSKQDILSFRTSGNASRLLVKVGDSVKKGDLLAELEVSDTINQLQQARIDLEVAQAALDKANNDRDYAAKKANLDIVIAKARMDLAAIDVDNTTGTAHDKAALNYQIAQQNYQQSILAWKQISDATSTREQQVVERQKLVVERLESLLADRQIFAPYDGVILRVTFVEGKPVSAFTSAIEIGDPADLIIRAQPDSKLQSSMDRDTQVQMSFSSEANDAHGVHYLPDFVPFNALSAKKDLVYTQDWMYFSIPTDLASSQLKLGTTVNLNIILGHRENVLLLPPAAVRSYRGLNFVIVQDGDQRRRVEISKIGLQTDKRWEIEADLKEGDHVIGQ